MLVADLADDHLQQVLHGGQAGGVSVLVHHDHHVGVFLLHLAHEVADGLGFGHEDEVADQLAHGAVLALFFFDLEHVAHVDEAGDMIDVPLVHRNARELLVDDELPQLSERGIGGNGDDVRPRRHHFPHHLVAELDHRLHQFPVLLFNETLFGAGRDQRLDVFGGGGRLFRGGGVIRQIHQRLEEPEHSHARAGDPRQSAQRPHQREEPLAGGAAIQKLG